VQADPVGSGPQALTYVAPSSFRVALSHPRLRKLADGHVTLQSNDAQTDPLHTQLLPVKACIRRCLPHVRPPRCSTVRSYGFRASRTRHRLATRTDLLHVKPVATPPPPHAPAAVPDRPQAERRCPPCGSIMRRVGDIVPTRFRLHGARASP